MSILHSLFMAFEWFILSYILFINSSYLFLILRSFKELRAYMKKLLYSEYKDMEVSSQTPPISILVPAFNESQTIEECVRSFLWLNYPEYEVIVVNDGSTDQTLDILKEKFNLLPTSPTYRKQLQTQDVRNVYRSVEYPYLLVIDKENGGKSDSLNTGINFASYPYFCTVDADSILERDALLRTMRPIIEGKDDIVACGGIVRVANGCTFRDGNVTKVDLPENPWAIFQVIEYLRSFLASRLGFSSISCLLIISGAFGVFRKQDVLEVGGYNTSIVGEDMELVVRLHRYIRENKKNSKILFAPDPVCWTMVPESAKVLKRQRARWHRGLIETLLIHRRIFLNPAYGWLGMWVMPYFFLVEFLGPIIEFIGYIIVTLGFWFHIVEFKFFILFLLLSISFGMFLSLSAVILEEWSLRRYQKSSDLFTLFVFSVMESFFYRQMVASFCTIGLFEFLLKKKGWGVMERQSFSTHPVPTEDMSEKQQSV